MLIQWGSDDQTFEHFTFVCSSYFYLVASWEMTCGNNLNSKHDVWEFTRLNIVWVGNVLDKSFWIGIIWVKIFRMGIILGENFLGGNSPGGSYPGWEFSGWELSLVRIFFAGSFPVENCPVGTIRVAIFRVAVSTFTKICKMFTIVLY